jgi:hypothetical protein
MEFGCENCGCSAVTLPEELVDGALVRCNRCRRVFCTWAEFKEQTRRVLMEGERERNDELAVPTNGTDLPDKPRVLAFDPFFPRKGQDRSDRSQPLRPVSDLRRLKVETRAALHGSPDRVRVERFGDGEAVYRQRAP